MPRDRLPEAVPLSQINVYSDNVALGSLGSPLGFDQDRLLVNLRSIERFRTAAGFDKVIALSRENPVEQATATVDGLGADGTAMLASLGVRSKNKLSQGSVQYRRGKGGLLETPNAVITISISELETRIEDRNGNVYEPIERAMFLNHSLRRGLFQASLLASFSLGDCLLSATMYGLAAAEYGVPNMTWAYLGIGASAAFGAINVHRRLDDGEDISAALKRQRPSLFFGISPDRFAASVGVLAMSKIIKAKQ